MADQNLTEDLNRTQNCPVVNPPRAENLTSPASWGWKALAASTAIVMTVGGTATAVSSLQSDTRTLYTEMIHMAAQHPAVPSTPAVTAFPQPQVPVVPAPEPIALRSAAPVAQEAAAVSDGKSSIDEPPNGSVIDDSFVPVSGRVDPNVKESVWILCFPQRSPGRAWPQSADASTGAPAVRIGDTFQVPAFLGGEAQSYDLALVAAGPLANKRFSSYLRAAARSNQHTGIAMADMPAGLKELARITVRTTRAHY